MTTLTHYDWSDKYEREVNRQMMSRADLAADAELGRVLLRELDVKWFREGQAAFWAGESIDTLWNDVQRAGWQQAQEEAEALLDEMLCRPGLGVEPACCPDCGYPLEVNYYGELVCGDCLYVEVA